MKEDEAAERESAVQAPVLIVEDEALLAWVWRQVLENAGYPVGVAGSVAEARAMLRRALYEVILLDLLLPDESGTVLLEDFRQRPQCSPVPATAVVSGYIEASHVLSFNDVVDRFIPKPITHTELLTLVDWLVATNVTRDPVTGFSRQFFLSHREAAVLRASTQGKQNKEIAAELNCRPSTVTTYWKRIFEKTGCRSRHQIHAVLLRHSTKKSS